MFCKIGSISVCNDSSGISDAALIPHLTANLKKPLSIPLITFSMAFSLALPPIIPLKSALNDASDNPTRVAYVRDCVLLYPSLSICWYALPDADNPISPAVTYVPDPGSKSSDIPPTANDGTIFVVVVTKSNAACPNEVPPSHSGKLGPASHKSSLIICDAYCVEVVGIYSSVKLNALLTPDANWSKPASTPYIIFNKACLSLYSSPIACPSRILRVSSTESI